MWDYFPLLSQNLHETDYEELPGIVERDVHTQVIIYKTTFYIVFSTSMQLHHTHFYNKLN